MNKKLFSILMIICLILSSSLIFTACGTNDNKNSGTNVNDDLITAPTQTYVISCLEKVPGVMEVEAVTESNDPNNLLNKAGGYYASIYFSYQLVKQSEIHGDTLIDKGVDAGGCIEIYNTADEATKRNEYLAAFDGTFLHVGSHKVVGTMVVRTSAQLQASQQAQLESNIISIFSTGTDSSVDVNIGENVNVK